VPTTLPEFSLQDRDGQMRSIRSWPGKSLIVNFWATWCAPCRREIPLLKQMQKEHGAAGFQVVGVAIDFRDDVLKYAKEIGMDYPILIGEQDGMEAAGKFGLGTGLPFTVFTDTQGRIVVTHLGELSKPQSEILIAVVGRVNKGELTPAAAQVVATKQLQELEPAKG
jgi:thiol-disulfide isomerase/thioredoxin